MYGHNYVYIRPLSYPGGLVPTVVHIYEMSVTMNQLLNALIQHISVL